MNKLYSLICCLTVAVSAITAQTTVRIDVINATTDEVVKELTNGTTFTLAEAQDINFQGVTDGDMSGKRGQFFVRLEGNQIIARSEGVAPYAAFIDNNGNYDPWSFFATPPVVGNYEIDFLIVLANGDTQPAAGEKITRSFSVVEAGASIDESKKLALLSFYNNGMITVKNPKAEAGVVSIYSLNGVEVNRFNFSKSLTEIPATFKKGIYIINVKTETERFTGKFSVL
jgi:hypothetical protein